jgi:hypothetical protein
MMGNYGKRMNHVVFSHIIMFDPASALIGNPYYKYISGVYPDMRKILLLCPIIVVYFSKLAITLPFNYDQS